MAMRVITVTIEFEFGQIVYLKTDADMNARMVIGYELTPGRLVRYILQQGIFEPSYHFGFEIATSKAEVEACYANELE